MTALAPSHDAHRTSGQKASRDSAQVSRTLSLGPPGKAELSKADTHVGFLAEDRSRPREDQLLASSPRTR